MPPRETIEEKPGKVVVTMAEGMVVLSILTADGEHGAVITHRSDLADVRGMLAEADRVAFGGAG